MCQLPELINVCNLIFYVNSTNLCVYKVWILFCLTSNDSVKRLNLFFFLSYVHLKLFIHLYAKSVNYCPPWAQIPAFNIGLWGRGHQGFRVKWSFSRLNIHVILTSGTLSCRQPSTHVQCEVGTIETMVKGHVGIFYTTNSCLSLGMWGLS